MAEFNTFETLLQLAGVEKITSHQPTPKRVKFMLVGTHAQQTTGYSKVTYNIIKELAKYPEIELYHFGFQRFFDMGPAYRAYPPGVDAYDPQKEEATRPEIPKEQGFGFSQLAGYVKRVKPDIMMIYNDASIICTFLEKLDQGLAPHERTYKLLIYLDQVYTLQRPAFLDRIDRDAHGYFTFTNYWRDVLRSQGIQKPIHVLRHGFDHETFKPMNRQEIRAKHNLPQNLFLLLNLNRNTPRKRFDLVIVAFAELVCKYPQKPIGLLAVTDAGTTGGFSLHEIYIRELQKRNVNVEHHIHKLMITKTALNYTDETINELYAASDVGITAADGEGFGLCHFEAMGVGVPQVVPDIGGFKDFCHSDNSVPVSAKNTYYLPMAYSPIGGEVHVVDPHDLCLGIEEYLLDSEKREEHGKKARETVLSYKWSDEVKNLANVILHGI